MGTITIESDLFFPAAEKLGDQIMLYQELYKTKRVVLNLEKVDEMDSAAAQSIKSTIESSIKKDVSYQLITTDERIVNRLAAAGIYKLIKQQEDTNHNNGHYGTFERPNDSNQEE